MGDAGDEKTVNGISPAAKTNGEPTSFNVKAGLAKMMKGGVIMDVVNAEQVSLSLGRCNAFSHNLGSHCRGSRCMRSHGA